MKTILRHYVVDTLSLYLATQIASGVVFAKGTESLLLAGVGLTVATMLIRPLINILLLPINLITFNFFKWISSAIALYLVTIVVPGFKIIEFGFQGLSTKWIDLPSFGFQGVFAFVAFSFLLSTIASFINWLIK